MSQGSPCLQKQIKRLHSTAFCLCTGKPLINCHDAVRTSSAASCCFICELQFVCTGLCDTSSLVDNAGETKGVTDDNCCLRSDDVKVVTVGTGGDFCTRQPAVGVENVVTGIGEATVTDGGSENCWTEVAGCAVVLANTKTR